MRKNLAAVLAVLLAAGAAGAWADPAPWQAVSTRGGNRVLLLSDFEADEGLWVGYSQENESAEADVRAAPAAHFDVSTMHPGTRPSWHPRSAGHGFSAEQVRSGRASLKWSDTAATTRIVADRFPKDWTGFEYLSLWAYSERATSAGIELVCYSENVGLPEDDYYKWEIIVDWEGWKLLEIRLDQLRVNRSPAGWQRIDYIKIASTGWSHTPQRDTVLHLDRLELTTGSVREELLAAIPVSFPDRQHPSLFLTAADLESLRRKIDSAPWAAAAYARVRASADALAAKPPLIPRTGGGFYHDAKQAEEYEITEEHYRLSRAARDLALVGQLERSQRHLRAAAEILIGYARLYPTYEVHDKEGRKGKKAQGGGRATSQSINEAKWVIPLAWACDMAWTAMSEGERATVETSVFRAAAELIRANNEGRHNHQAWHNAAVGVIGFLLRDAACVRYAIHSPDSGFLYQMRASITADGMWYEGSPHYHFYTMEPLLSLAEAARACGIDLYAEAALRRFFAWPPLVADSTGALPLLNDGRRVVLSESDRARWLEIAFARLGDSALVPALRGSDRASFEALVFGVEPLPEASPAPPRSVLLDGALALLRSPDGRLQVVLNALPFAGGHSHSDKLSLVMSDSGRVLAADAGSLLYRDPAHEGYFKQTLAHNTLLRDRASQQPAGKPAAAEVVAGGFAQLARLRDESAYPGTTLERTVLLTDSYVLDLFEARSPEPHLYEWVFHGTGRLEPPAGLSPARSEGAGFALLDKVRCGALPAAARLVWRQPQGESALHVLGGGCDLTVGESPVAADRDDVAAPFRLDTVLLGRSGRDALFATLIVPPGSGAPAAVEELDGGVAVRRGAVEDVILYRRPGARLAFVRREAGRPTRIFVADGSALSLAEGSIAITPAATVEVELLLAEVRVRNLGSAAATIELRGFGAGPAAAVAQPGVTVIRH